MSGEIIGASGGVYQARFKDGEGKWGRWSNLGGGLKTSDVEVELVMAADESVGPMWNALLNYVLDNRIDEPLELLRLWREGSFDEIRQEWPDVPQEMFPSPT